TRGGQRERFASYEEARKAVEQAALDEVATRDRDLLQELLEGFARAYTGAKERESGVDFEDLQLTARDLLREHDEIRQREAWRFRAVKVDEFQDTNRLQCDLIDLIAGDELFFVGDEFQSIYGFRHADVNVFRERREEAGSVLPGRTPSGTSRNCASSAYRPTARPAAATSASSRWPTCSPTCGCCTTATTTRRSSPCSPRRWSAFPTTRSCCCGGRRRSARSSRGSSEPSQKGSTRATNGFSRRSASASSGSSRRRGRSRSSGSARRSAPRPITTSPFYRR